MAIKQDKYLREKIKEIYDNNLKIGWKNYYDKYGNLTHGLINENKLIEDLVELFIKQLPAVICEAIKEEGDQK